MTQSTAVPSRKVFAELFSKSDPLARRRPEAPIYLPEKRKTEPTPKNQLRIIKLCARDKSLEDRPCLRFADGLKVIAVAHGPVKAFGFEQLGADII